MNFPVDIWSYKQLNGPNSDKKVDWNFFSEGYRQISYKVLSIYDQHVKDAVEIKDCFIVERQWVDNLISFIQALYTTETLGRLGLKAAFSERSDFYRSINSGEATFHLVKQDIFSEPTIYEKFRAIVFERISEYKNYGIKECFSLFPFDGEKYLTFDLIGNQFLYPKLYAQSLGQKLVFVHRRRLMPTLQTNSPEENIRKSVSTLLNKIETGIKDCGLKGFYFYKDYISDELTVRLSFCKRYMSELARKLEKISPTSIFVQSMGNTFIRMLCLAAKNQGFNIVGFPHGHCGALVVQSPLAQSMFQVLDTYIVPSESFAKVSTQIATANDHSVCDIQFKVFKNPYYRTLLKSVRGERVNTLKKIMVMEIGLSQRWHYWALNWPYQVTLYKQCAQLIKQKGLKAVLKKHPDFISESAGLYEDVFDEVKEEPFENCYDFADAYIISFFGSSIIGFVLHTNKPIITFENAFNHICPEAEILLRKRCIVISSYFAEDGRFVFDHNQFMNALVDPIVEPNDDYINNFFNSSI